MENQLRGKSAIIGTGHAGFGEAPGLTAYDIMAQAGLAALADAELKPSDVDGLFCTMMEDSMPALMAAEYLGIRPRFVEGTMTGGSSFVNYVAAATMALEARLCDVALIVYGSNQRSGSGKLVTASRPPPYEQVYQPRYPVSAYALAAARHMHDFGTTRQQLADVAVAARAWAQHNPEAFARGDLTREDVLASRMVSDPLTVRDCCLVTDGGGALVMVRSERARDFPKPPVYVLGCGAGSAHRQISQMPDFTVTAARESGARAFAAAGVSPSDIDVVELYDAFTINTILFLEDLGFCKKGEGGAFAEGGRIAPGGDLPVNTNGGGLSCVHPGMYGIFTVIEAARQIRGDAPGLQIANVDLALAHGNGGTLSSQITAILGSENTLRNVWGGKAMPLNHEALANWKFEEVRQTLTKRDTMLYALALGFGEDPLDEKELAYVYEDGLMAVPSMAVTLGYPGFWLRDPRIGIDWKKVLHGEQWLEVYKPLPVDGELIGRTRIDQISDKGESRGAVIYMCRDIIDTANGETLAKVSMSTFCRGDGGFGGENKPGPTPASIPERVPDHVCELVTLPQQALIYRLLGDYNPLHADPKVARAAGFERPILHGLATYGLAARAILKVLCDYEAGRLTGLDVRFSAPVYPGETVRFDIWREGDEARFRASVPARQVVVLNNGAARFA